jgi:hypothetical protein
VVWEREAAARTDRGGPQLIPADFVEAGRRADDQLVRTADGLVVVPGAVEQDDLADGGQVLCVPLEVPLAALALGGYLGRHHPRSPRVQVLGEVLDRAALADRVTALEEDHDAAACLVHPVLEREQLYLQQPLGMLISIPVQALGVG